MELNNTVVGDDAVVDIVGLFRYCWCCCLCRCSIVRSYDSSIRSNRYCARCGIGRIFIENAALY
jgi:hypothetical protein